MALPKRIVLDTDVMIDHLRGRLPSPITQMQGEFEMSTTVVNSFELYHGAHKSKNAGANLAAAKGLLSTLGRLPFDETSADKAGAVLAQLELRGISIDMRDLLVGCISLAHGFPLLTKNRKHFERIPELLVVTPESIDP